MNATNYWAAALNIAVGAAAWSLGGQAPVPQQVKPPKSRKAKSRTKREEEHPFGRRLVVFSMVGFGLSGLTSIAYEVVWARYLSLFLINSTYAYSTILTVFLLGLVAGNVLFSRFFDRRQNLIEIFGYLQVAIGLSSLMVLPSLLKLYAQMGSLAEAEKAYREAMKADATFADALDLSLLLAQSGRIDEAIEATEALLRRNPKEQRARRVYDRLLEMKERSRR